MDEGEKCAFPGPPPSPIQKSAEFNLKMRENMRTISTGLVVPPLSAGDLAAQPLLDLVHVTSGYDRAGGPWPRGSNPCKGKSSCGKSS